MFVDDEPRVLEALRRSLRHRRSAWDMVFVTDPNVALRQHLDDPCTVVVTDLRMPGLDGIALAKAIHEETPATGCIMLTGTADLATASTVINETRIFRFYTKPCAPEVLERGIADFLSDHDQPGSTPDLSKLLTVRVLDRLPAIVLVLDPDGRAVHLNQGAARLVADNDVLFLGPNGECRAGNSAETASLRAALRICIEAGDDDTLETVTLTRSDGERRLIAVVAPLATEPGEITRHALMLASDPERDDLLDERAIARFFGLTASESRLAVALARGRSLDQAAVDQGITVESARTYLKRILQKTGTARQGELIRELLLAPTLRRSGPETSDA
jgi:DNA-binding NarL/FixJ family response regulator